MGGRARPTRIRWATQSVRKLLDWTRRLRLTVALQDYGDQLRHPCASSSSWLNVIPGGGGAFYTPMHFGGAWAKSTVVRSCGFRTCRGRCDDTRDRHPVGTLRVPPEIPPPTVFRGASSTAHGRVTERYFASLG